MKLQNNKLKGGFTIIEVVLVLAIAGLIFLIVFLAVPALQKSQRDTQRKQDLARFITQLTNYQSNHQGVLPAGTNWSTGSASFVNTYMVNGGETFNDPTTGTTYNASTVAPGPPANTTTPNTTIGTLLIYRGAACNAVNASGVAAAGARSVAVLVPLEKGGFLCQNT